jgi:signal transduction histidine kinase
MEQRLLDAQQKLLHSEKQALVAELAGAAAHELNQPLTSIMGYTQLIERQSAKDAAHLRAVKVILSEAERMAGIVKKIGKITKYETTDYVGSARMLDIEASTSHSSAEIDMPTILEDSDAIPTVPADESQTGEFHAVKPGTERALHPSMAELSELDPSRGGKP